VPDEPVLAELERLVAHVEKSSAALRSLGRPTDSQLAYAGGALEVLRSLDLITDVEFQEWFDRAHQAAGGEEEHPLVELRDATTSVKVGPTGLLDRLRWWWRARRQARGGGTDDVLPLANGGGDVAAFRAPVLERPESDRWWHETGGSELRQVLFWRWDPIGVADAFPVTADEYDDYLQPLLEQLAAGGGAEDVQRLLAGIERRMMDGPLSRTPICVRWRG
jgi:hypothetical protein